MLITAVHVKLLKENQLRDVTMWMHIWTGKPICSSYLEASELGQHFSPPYPRFDEIH